MSWCSPELALDRFLDHATRAGASVVLSSGSGAEQMVRGMTIPPPDHR